MRTDIMTFTLGLAQTCDLDGCDVLSDVRSFCMRAAEEGVDLLVFPESLMTPFELETSAFIASAQKVDGPFATQVASLAHEFGLWIAFTMNEYVEGFDKPCNTAIIVDSQGTLRGSYRKAHLFDSSTHTESEKMVAGNELFEIVDAPFAKIGIGICYDLRFPEYARSLALDGCELLLFPAAWVDGPGKARQWKTLLSARAIENELFVAGVSRASEGYVGESVVYAPDGSEIAHASVKERDLLVAKIDLRFIDEMRRSIPVISHRRPELYGRLTEASRTREARQ